MEKTKKSFPEDLITMEILPRINSANSLFQFKSVSKYWNSIISSNPNFAKLHLQFQKQNNGDYTALLYYSDRYPILFSLKALNLSDPKPIKHYWNHEEYHKFRNYYLLGSSHGLICFYQKPKNNYVLWNPLTQAFRIIRGHSDVKRSKNDCIMRQGFGYSPTCDTYKIVVVSVLTDRCCVYIFSTRESTRWRRVVDIGASSVDVFNRQHRPTDPSVQVGESLHWSLNSTISNEINPVILAFDLASDSVHSVPLPDHSGQVNLINSCIVSSIGGQLCVAWCGTGVNTNVFALQVWMLERESWKLYYNHTGAICKDPVKLMLQGLLEVKHESTRRIFVRLYHRFFLDEYVVELPQPVRCLVKPPLSHFDPRRAFVKRTNYPQMFWTVEFIESFVSPFPHERRASTRLAGIKRNIT